MAINHTWTSLVNDENVVVGAMNRIRRRTVAVRHHQKKWYDSVRERQDEEDAVQDNEAVMIKKEAQLFKRYVKEMEVRRQRKKRREDKQKQDAFLDQAYEERLKQEGDTSEEWDPIEQSLKGEREDLVALMHRLLWLEKFQQPDEFEPNGNDTEGHDSAAVPSPLQEDQQPSSATRRTWNPVQPQPNARQRAKAKPKANAAPAEDTSKHTESDNGPKIEVNETREQMRKRLIDGISYEEHRCRAVLHVDRPEGERPDMPGDPESDVDKILDEVAEVKEFTWVAQWSGQEARRQQLQLGIISYLDFSAANQMTIRRQPGRKRVGARSAVQFKNITCFAIKRNDPVSRRFVQYLSMQSRYVCLMVRDAKTGKILVQPPKEHRRLIRIQGGLGRDDWVEKLHVGEEELYGLLESFRKESWQFGFNDYYDVTVWDLLPGEPIATMYSILLEAMRKARRICVDLDQYSPVAPFMKTLHREVQESADEIGRVRDARPGETTLYDEVTAFGTKFLNRQIDPLTGEMGESNLETPENYFYSDIDAAGDLVLFPEEVTGVSKKAITGAIGALSHPEDLGLPNMKRSVYDLDSDQEEFDMDDPFEDTLGKKALEAGADAQKQIAAEENWETEESDYEDWPEPPEDLPPCPNPEAYGQDCDCPECLWWEENDKLMVEEAVKRDGIAPFTELDVDAFVSDSTEASRLKDFIFDEPDIDEMRNTQSEFTIFMDREMSKSFKRMWHAAEFDPEITTRWFEMQSLVKEKRAEVVRRIPMCIQAYHILMWLGVHP